MNFIKIKEEMKKWQAKDKAFIKELENEIKKLKNGFIETAKFTKENFSLMFPKLYMMALEDDRFQKGLKMSAHLPFDLERILNIPINGARKVYNLNQIIINAMDNDKIINYIDIERLIRLLVISELPYDYRFDVFKAVVGFDIKYMNEHHIIYGENALYLEPLSEYISENGELLLNENSSYFETILDELLQDFYNFHHSDDIRENVECLIAEFSRLLQENNQKLKNQPKLETKTAQRAFESNTNIDKESREALEILKKYYKNGELLELPNDIESFIKLLNECKLDEKEKRYILGLINIELAKRKENKILKYIDNSGKELFIKAQDLLNELNHTDGDYYTLIQLLDDLKAAGDMLDEINVEEEKEELLLEVEVLLSDLREVIGKYIKEDEVSENNILFLLNDEEVPYLKEDSDNLDGSFYKMISSGIKKIRKDNQSSFRLVLTTDNMPYRTYDIISSKVHLSFIEIDNGIYVIVGVDASNHGYEKIVKRVIYNVNQIKALEEYVKNKNNRNGILLKHEEYLSEFISEVPNVGRKRVNQYSNLTYKD